ncbi:MAG: toprim domain-containing protein [Conexivisphaerales archaeon]|jgi:5S rRNA maturation endonuclease (ribonuclease M5)
MDEAAKRNLRRKAKPTASKDNFAKQREERHNRLDEVLALDRLTSLVSQLNAEADEMALVVVEGVRDERALQHLGFKGSAFKLCHTRNSLSAMMAEAESHRKVILLLDYDLKGRSLTKKIASMLQNKGMNVDTSFRREIRAMTNGRANHIEDLKRFT